MNVVEELRVCDRAVYIAIEVECSSFHVLTAVAPTDRKVEIRRAIP